MKIVLTPRRHPSMTRPQFFDYLRNTHWSLVASYPDVIELLTRYTQNHSILPEDGADVPTPFRRAVERDSVIEIWMDDPDGLEKLHKSENYLQFVRPDEGRFNDLPTLIVLVSEESEIFTSPTLGRLKRFDFIRRHPDLSPEEFQQRLRATLADFALDPMYRALADRQTVHLPIGVQDPGSSPDATCDAVLSTWTSSFESLTRLADTRFSTPVESLADVATSFSVVAATFPVKLAA